MNIFNTPENFVFITFISILITLFTTPSIIHIARLRHLYDDIGYFRKEHDHGIPRLGGVAIFISFTITLLVFRLADNSYFINYLLIAAIILFAMGVKDDLSGVNSSTKFLVQFIVSLILVVLGNIRLTSMYGILGIFDLPYIISISLSILVMILVINAFNLIDGIDGLAATTGIIANSAFSVLFIYMHHYELAIISLAIVGSLIGFLKFNLTPAKIFMGDAGSLLIGLISVIMAIKLIEINKFMGNNSFKIYSAPAVTVAILIGPIFDTLRVFIIRLLKGVSPFEGDRNHIHHRMLKLGYTHLQTTIILAGLNITAIIMVLLFSSIGNFILIVLIFLFSILFNWTITFFIRCRERERLTLRNLFV
ncbi:MAG: undecaprenyl/decaprenyl-phosphate alpha-N-acetylglucosaminyl 1-phosphate transferase [Mucilaginibacter sp.]|nr:undecaprenyl/decaprenyl-phosphate alpha-N-acetylglucosaminyl 1-phosphate transferase [Mucilaginibacter sp.]